MKVPGLPALALILSSLLTITWSISGGGCSQRALVQYNCFQPIQGEPGADGGPDPCHCNVPPPYADRSCLCTSNDILAEGLTGIEIYHECTSLLPADAGGSDDVADAGDDAEGGPLVGLNVPDASDTSDTPDAASFPVCSGTCWLLPPPGWTPVLLWTGAQSDASAALCPLDVAPVVVFDGAENDPSGTFAVACGGTESGPCPEGRVCGPVVASGFQGCVMSVGNLSCAGLGPYPNWSVFYEGTAPEVSVAYTFCCPNVPSSPM